MSKVKDAILENQDTIKRMLEEGCIGKEIAEEIGISYASWKKYRNSYPELKLIVDTEYQKKNKEVEEVIYKCAVGYHYYEEVAQKVKEESIVDGQVVVTESVKVVKVKRYCKADLNAQKYWLNNMDKRRWKDDPNKVSYNKELLKLKQQEAKDRVW